MRSDPVLAVRRSRCEGQESSTSLEVSVVLPLPAHLQARSNTPSAFLFCRVRRRLDSETSTCQRLSATVLQTRLWSLEDCVHRHQSWREPKKKLRLLVTQGRLQRWINSEVHVLHCSPSSRRPSSCAGGHCKVCPSRGFLPMMSLDLVHVSRTACLLLTVCFAGAG